MDLPKLKELMKQLKMTEDELDLRYLDLESMYYELLDLRDLTEMVNKLEHSEDARRQLEGKFCDSKIIVDEVRRKVNNLNNTHTQIEKYYKDKNERKVEEIKRIQHFDKMLKELSHLNIELGITYNIFKVRENLIKLQKLSYVDRQTFLPALSRSEYDVLDRILVSVFLKWNIGNAEDKREFVLEQLRSYIKAVWPTAQLSLFGSSCNGFPLKNSDLDVSLSFPGNKDDINSVGIIERLSKELKDKMKNVNSVLTARVPILKLVDPSTNINVDISLYNELGRENTKMLNLYSKIDIRVKQLGYVAKLFVKECDIGNAFHGSLSSYAYIIMMIFYLQQVSPPVVPVLQEMYSKDAKKPKVIVEGWNVWFLSDLEKVLNEWSGFNLNTMTIGELWIGFLEFYGCYFNDEEVCICIRQLKPLNKAEKKWETSCMAIEDPFVLNQNLSAGISVAMKTYIKKLFLNARLLFGSPIIDEKLFSDLLLQDYFFIQENLFNRHVLKTEPAPNALIVGMDKKRR